MFTQLHDATYQDVFAKTEEGICIFFKKLCPHCTNMEKVLQKVSAKQPAIAMYSIDSEESLAAAESLNAQRAPTIIVIKKGQVVGTRGGLMNPKELIAFFASC